MLLMRNAVHAALFLIVNFFCLAIFYLILGAPFLFAVQIIVYAGAIMVLFLFVIMLLGVDGREDLRERRLIAQRPIAIALGVAFVLEVFFAVRAGIGFSRHAPAGFDAVNEGGNTQALAKVLFRKYFFPFEVTSILLIIAAIAAMVLAQRKARADHAGRDRSRTTPRSEPAGAPEAGRDEHADRVFPGALRRSCSRSAASACLVRKQRAVIFMSVELQLNAVNLTLVAFSRMHNSLDGQVLAFFSMVVAAAEVVVGLAIIVSVYRRIRSVNVDEAEALRG